MSKSKDKDASVVQQYTITDHLKKLLGSYHSVIYVVLVVLGLSYAIFILVNILNNSSVPTDYKPSTTRTSFDTDTSNRVSQLRPLSEKPNTINLPDGRTNPFAS